MSETRHTPTPWVVGTQLNDHGFVIRGDKNCYVARIGENLKERNANATFIVNAVNAHDALVEIAKMVDAWGHGIRHQTEHESKLVKAARAALATLA